MGHKTTSDAGTETIHKLANDQISQHSNRLSVKTYKSYCGQVLKPKVRKTVPG